jgi:hypothetical protein
MPDDGLARPSLRRQFGLRSEPPTNNLGAQDHAEARTRGLAKSRNDIDGEMPMR